ncbi:hypothetical protein AB0F52_33240 [Amycolatopsis sp. NPDC024027]|uniref:DUF4760 domain-containing protein n=1 Tax=Amycolatopsis sp. NPDC024027 TaxID=3154327 RepID=UPI0033CA68BA
MNLVASIVSLLVSVGALVAAIWSTFRSRDSSMKANSLRVTTEVFQKVGSAEFREHLARIMRGPEEVPSQNGGIEALAPEYRDSVYSVCYFFDYLGVLLAFGLIERDLVIGSLGTHIVRTWSLLEPHIVAEREHRSQAYPADAPAGFLRYFESLVALVRRSGGRSAGEVITRRLGLPELGAPAARRGRRLSPRRRGSSRTVVRAK